MPDFDTIKTIIEFVCGIAVGYFGRMAQVILKKKKQTKKTEKKQRIKKVEKPKEQTTLTEIPAEQPKQE